MRPFTWFVLAVSGLAVGILFADSIETLKGVPSTFVYPVDGYLPFNLHRAGQTLLALELPGDSFTDPKGVACALLNVDKDPSSPDNDVVVTAVGVNSGKNELIYNVGLKSLYRFGTLGGGAKEFRSPTGVAIDPDGDVAVADTGNNRIVLLKHDGHRLNWVGVLGTAGSKAGQFLGPLGVAYDSQGNLYIADTGNDRIEVKDRGAHVRVLPIQGLVKPSAIAVVDGQQSWTAYPQGPYANRLAVIDEGGTRVQTFTLDGQPLASITADQMPDGPVKLWGCAFDYYGNLVATDIGASCLRKFDQDLHYLVTFGGPGTDDFQFTEPRGIAIQPQFGQILVAEKDSAQLFWNGADALDLSSSPASGQLTFPFFLTERAYVTAAIKTPAGDTVAVLADKQDMQEGKASVDWIPSPATPAGPYSLVLDVMATYSSREKIQKEEEVDFDYSK